MNDGFEVNISGIALEHPVMLGAGVCRLFDGPEGIKEVCRSMASAITLGSITWLPREGNSGEVFWNGKEYSLNSMGLPNRGEGFYRANLPEMVKWVHAAGKACFVSVAGFTVQEYADLSELAAISGADMVELNMSCPNVRDEGRIGCFNPAYVADVLAAAVKRIGNSRISIKISPFSDPYARKEIADVIYGLNIKTVIASNTFPDAVGYSSSGHSLITSNPDGFSGMSGPSLKPMALGQIAHLRKTLRREDGFAIIGCGGIGTGQDVSDYLRAGADAVQLVTKFLSDGSRIFNKILSDLIDKMG